MADHNLSARLWATAALLAVPVASLTGLGWWLPLHLALLGAVTQAIVGGQLMFSSTLGMARGPDRTRSLTQLVLLNLAGLLVIAGRWAGVPLMLGVGTALLIVVVAWLTWQVGRMWRRSVNRRFAVTGTFYTLAGISILAGASIGGALGIGALDDGGSYIAHRTVHMIVNVFGWAGMTIVGTAITLLPTILHVRSPRQTFIRPIPWMMLGGLIVFSTGATLDIDAVAGVGMLTYVGGLIAFALHVRAVLAVPRRRRIPTAAFHLIAALAWAFVTATALVVSTMQGDHVATRDLVVVGGAGGFVLQALLGAWSFLLPSTRPPVPQRRRRELVAMEFGGLAQVLAYNVGLVAVAVGLRTGIGSSLPGILLVWSVAAWALVKAWAFPSISTLPSIGRLSDVWWADPPSGGRTAGR